MEQTRSFGIPLDIDGFFKHRRFERSNTLHSIASHIHLLLITVHEEFGFDTDFGCDLWDHEFESEHISKVWVDRMAESIKHSLERYETRLTDMEVKAELTQAEFSQKHGDRIARSLKKRLTIRLSARLRSTNEVFRLEDSILLSPFSMD